MSDPIKKIKEDLAAVGKNVSEDRIKERMSDPAFRKRYFEGRQEALGYKDYGQFEAALAPHVKTINAFDDPITKARKEPEDIPTPVIDKGAYQFEQEQKQRTEKKATTTLDRAAESVMFGAIPERLVQFYEEPDPQVSQNVRNLNQQIQELRKYREDLVAPLEQGQQIDQQELQTVDADIAKMVDQSSRYKAENRDKLPIEHLTPREYLNKVEDIPAKAQIQENYKLAEDVEAIQRGEGKDIPLTQKEFRQAMAADPATHRFLAEYTTNNMYLTELGRAQSQTMTGIADKYGEDIWEVMEKAADTPDKLSEKERYALTQLSQDPEYQRLVDIDQTRDRWNTRTASIIDKYPTIKEVQRKGEMTQRALDAVVKDNPIIGSAGDFAKRLAKGVVLNSIKTVNSSKFTHYEDLMAGNLGIPQDGPLFATSTKYQKPFRTKVAKFKTPDGNELQAHYNHDGQFVGTYDSNTGLLVSKLDPKLYSDDLEGSTNWASGAAMGTEVMGDLVVTALLTKGIGSAGSLLRVSNPAKFARFVGTPVASFTQYQNRWVQQGLQEGMTIDQATNYSLGVSGMIAMLQPIYGFEAKLGERIAEGMWKGVTAKSVQKAITNPQTFWKTAKTVLKETLGETAEESLENVMEMYVANNIANEVYGTQLQTKYKDWNELKEDFYETAFVTAFATGPLSAVTAITDKSADQGQLRNYFLSAVKDINKYKTLIGELRSQGNLDNSKNYYEDELETISTKHGDIFASDEYTEEAKKDIIMNELASMQYAAKAAAAQDPESAVAKKATEQYNEAQGKITEIINSKKGAVEQGFKEAAKIARDEQQKVRELREEKAAAQAPEEAAKSNSKQTPRQTVAEQIRAKVEGRPPKPSEVTPNEEGMYEVPTSNSAMGTTTKVDEKTYKEWKALDDQEKADVEAAKARRLPQEQIQKLSKGIAMKYAAQKRKVLGTNTTKEQAKSESTITKGEQTEVEGTTFTVVAPSVFGKVRVRNEDTGEETLVGRDHPVPQAILAAKKAPIQPKVQSTTQTVVESKQPVEYDGKSIRQGDKLAPYHKRAYNAARFLSKLGMPIKVVVHESDASFFQATGTNRAAGVYMDGTIHLNQEASVSDKELQTRGIHEAWHPVLEHIKAANPALYSQIKTFMFNESMKNPYLNKKIGTFVARYKKANEKAISEGRAPLFSDEDLEEEAMTEFLTEVSENPNSLTVNGRKSLAKVILSTFKKFSNYFIGADRRNIEELKSGEIIEIIQAAAKAFAGDLSQANTLEKLITKATLEDFESRPDKVMQLRNWANVPAAEGIDPDELFGEGNWKESTINGAPSYVAINTTIDQAYKIAKDNGVEVITPDGIISEGKLTPIANTVIGNEKSGLPTVKVGDTVISFAPTSTGFRKKLSLEDQTETEEFKNWFGNSKVVDENGKPTIVYHQTSKENERSILENGGFDIDKGRARLSDSEVPDGFFFKPTTQNINVGATGEDISQMGVFLSIQTPLVAKNRNELSQLLGNLDEEYTELNNEVDRVDREKGREFDKLEKEWSEKYRQDKYDRYSELTGKYLDEWSALNKQNAAKARAKINEILKENGYDGVILREDEGSFGRKTETIIALQPTQIKSATDNIGTFDPSNPDIKFSLIAEHEQHLADHIEGIARIEGQGEKDAFVEEMADLFGVEPLEVVAAIAQQGLYWNYKGKRVGLSARRGRIIDIPITLDSFYQTTNSVELGEQMFRYAETVLEWGSPDAVQILFNEVDELDNDPTTRDHAAYLLLGMMKVADMLGDQALQKQVMDKLSKLSTAGGKVLNAMRAAHEHNILPSLNGVINDMAVQLAEASGVGNQAMDATTADLKDTTAYTEEEIQSAQAAAISAYEMRPDNSTLIEKAAKKVRSIFSAILGKASLLDEIVAGNGPQAIGDMMVEMVDNGSTGAQAIYTTIKALQKVNDEAALSPRGQIFADNEQILDFFRAALSTKAKGGSTRVGHYINLTSPYKVDQTKLAKILDYTVTAEEVLKDLVAYVYSSNNAGGKRLSEVIMGSPFFANYTLQQAQEIEAAVASDMQKKYGERVKSDIDRFIKDQEQKAYFGADNIKYRQIARSAVEKIADAHSYGLLADDTMKAMVAAMYLGDSDLLDTVNRIIDLSEQRAKTTSSVVQRRIDKEASWLAFKANPSSTGKFFVNFFSYLINGLLSGVTTLYAATVASLFVTVPRVTARSTYMLGRSALDAIKGDGFVNPFAFIADFAKSGQLKELGKSILPSLLRNDSRADHKQVFFGDSGINTMGSIKVQSTVDRALQNGIEDFYKAIQEAKNSPSLSTVGKAMSSFMGTALTFPLRVTSILKVYEQAVAAITVPYIAYTEAIDRGRSRGLKGNALVEYARKTAGFGNITAAHRRAARKLNELAADPANAHMFKSDDGQIQIDKNGQPVTTIRYKDLYGTLVQDEMLQQADNDFTVMGEYLYKDMQMMGQPEGAWLVTGGLNAVKGLKPQILQSPDKSNLGDTLKAVTKSTLGYALFPFARIIAQTITMTYRYSVLGGIVAVGKQATGNKSAYVGTDVARTIPKQFLKPIKSGDPDSRIRSNAEIYEHYLMVAGSAVAAFGYLFMSMFDWDDDELVLKEDRTVDVTFRLTGNSYQNTLQSPDQKVMSIRFRDTPEAKWGEWYTYRFAMAHIPMLAAIGSIRDEAVYSSSEEPINTSTIVWDALTAPAEAMTEQTFAMLLNTVTKAANEMTYSAKKGESDELVSGVGQIAKTAAVDIVARSFRTVLSGGNFTRDIYADIFKATDPEGGYLSSKTDNLPDELAMALFKDSPVFEKLIIGEGAKVYDSFGNMIPREFKTKQLAEMMAQGIVGPVPTPILNMPFILASSVDIDLTPKEDEYLAQPELKLISKYPRVPAPGKYRVPEQMVNSEGKIVILKEETKVKMQMDVAHNMRTYIRDNYDELNKFSEPELAAGMKLIFQDAAALMKWQHGYLGSTGVKPQMLDPDILLTKINAQNLKDEMKEMRTVEE